MPSNISRQFDVFLGAALDPATARQAFVTYARTALAEAETQNTAALGRKPSHRTLIDRVESGDDRIDQVRLGGQVTYLFQLADEMVRWIGDMLVQNSPVRTGKYKHSHIFTVDGVERDPAEPLPPGASELVFLNYVPYARKIERGLSKQAPDGVYESVALLARRRFGNVANIRFTYRSPLLAYVGLGGRKGGKKASAATRAAHIRHQDSRVPAIVITL